jgi:hypothetical protein
MVTTDGSHSPDPPSAVVAELAGEVRRLADRLRALSEVRLAGPLPPHPSRASAAHDLAQQLADAAAELTGGPRREVPRLPDLAVGDQVAVTGADLVAAAELPGVQGLESALRTAAAACRELRLAL